MTRRGWLSTVIGGMLAMLGIRRPMRTSVYSQGFVQLSLEDLERHIVRLSPADIERMTRDLNQALEDEYVRTHLRSLGQVTIHGHWDPS